MLIFGLKMTYDNIFGTILIILVKALRKCTNPANIYLSKVNNTNTRKKCDICSKLTIKTLEQRH